MNGEKGFTYFAALLLIVVVSTSIMVVQQQWSTIVARDKEKELFFRANQIVLAIESYYKSTPQQAKNYPRSFKYLIKDNRFPNLIRHLRKLYKDPMTEDGEWGVVYDGKGGIKGVYSKSNGKPFKIGGFSEAYKAFENKKKYSEWKFIFEPAKEKGS